MSTVLCGLMKKFINEYALELSDARITKNYKRPFGNLVRHEIKDVIQGKVDSSVYKVKGSVGATKWTDVPWIAVFDQRITTSARKGVYIVYLLNKDTRELFLTLNQGATDIAQNGSSDGKLAFTGIASSKSKKTLTSLKSKASEIRSNLKKYKKLDSGEINTGSDTYDAGCIFYKKYTVDDLVNDDDFFSDLNDFIQAYGEYYKCIFSKKNTNENINDTERKGDSEMPIKETLEGIKGYISEKGFNYGDGLIENFFLSLKSKPFVILAGISGTGKSKLAELFAEACGATADNGRYKLVPVRPDWSDSTDLFGHMNLSDRFVEGSIIEFIMNASRDLENPYFLCLDEMNLARVEYYFSDFLSVIETRKWSEDPQRITTDVLVRSDLWDTDPEAVRKYGKDDYRIPENLYIIGTVNMDETTFPFSRKVLDRANTIEFSEVDLLPTKIEASDYKLESLGNDLLKADYLGLPSDASLGQYIYDICDELEQINKELAICNSQIAYRVRDELVGYRVLNHRYGLMAENDAMDFEIMQKILPRLQGSSGRLKRTLCKLFVRCAGDFSGSNDMDSPELAENMRTTFDQLTNAENCPYPRSAKKIIDMVERYEEDGFTSFWA